MKSKAIFVKTLSSVFIGTLFGCASSGPKVELPPGTNPQPEITKTENWISKVRSKQYDQLSPSHFKSANRFLSDARMRTEKNEPSEKILDDLGSAMGQLQLVEEVGDHNASALATILTARGDALSVNAQTSHASEFADADKDLQKMGEDMETQSFHLEANKVSKLERRYSDLELAAIKTNNLSEARSLIEKAEKSDAEGKTPETYNAAKVQYESAARSIEANRHNQDTYQAAVAAAIQGARKLDDVLKTVLGQKTSEAAAVQIYDQKQQLAANYNSLENAGRKEQESRELLRAEQERIRALQGANQEYASKEAFTQKVEAMKGRFSPEEAEVLTDNNKIIIRLKSMRFSTARFELASSSLGTLQKVKELIKTVNPSRITVEGHTDSTGKRKTNMTLSKKRAEAVKKFFVAAKTLSADQIEAEGFGDEKPLMTNKTKEGRATNRRVDVVIESNME